MDNKAINPQHYKSASGAEVIDVIEDWGGGFALGNTIKYLLRAGRKESETKLKDCTKALWYIRRAIITGEVLDPAIYPNIYDGLGPRSFTSETIATLFHLEDTVTQILRGIAIGDIAGAAAELAEYVDRMGGNSEIARKR